MKKNKTLKRLNLGSISTKFPFSFLKLESEITPKGTKAIGEYLSQKGIALEVLDLSFTIIFIPRINNLTIIGGNYFGDEGLILLVHGLKRNKTVKKLNLSSAFPTYFLIYIPLQVVASLQKE